MFLGVDMNDTLEKTGPSLPVVEKKPHRPGGCVGIFFQLFDWNRRFAEKKLFSRKLLPPVRLKQSSKKFCGDEKQPKLRLIADENRGGFPTAKNYNGASNLDVDQKNGMRVPGLVARLMGLESMPTVRIDKPKKVPASGFVSGKAEKFVESVCGYAKEELNAEQTGIKRGLRPQKLQKTGVSERQPITRFRAERLPFKNVLPKSRKHHPKLPSPVKSPRNLSRKSSSKLMGAATRILEPGLQTSRSKCAVTYSNTLHRSSRNTFMEESTCSSSNQLEASEGFASVAPEGQPCRNCGYLLGNLDSTPILGKQPLIFASPFCSCVGSSYQGLETSNQAHSAFHGELEEELHEDYQPVAATVIDNVQPQVKLMPYESPSGVPIQRHCSQRCKPPRSVPESLSSNHRMPSENRMLQPRNRVSPRSKLNSLESNKVPRTTVTNRAKNFVSLNQSSSHDAKLLAPARTHNAKFESENRISSRQTNSVPTGRKRRPTDISSHTESSAFKGSTINNQSLGFPHAISGKKLGYDVHLINHQCYKGGLLHLQERTDDSGKMEDNVVSFTLDSRERPNSGCHEVLEKRVKNDLHFNDNLQRSALGENGGRKKFEKAFPLSRDELGALLEQKLKELTCQGDTRGSIAPKTTTATILKELISALTSGIPFQEGNLLATSGGRNSRFNHHLSNSASSTSSQVNATAVKLYVDQPSDSERPSPGSALEAYFSTESGLSGSMDDNQGYKMVNEYLDCSYHGTQLPNPDSKLMDSTASIKRAKNSKEIVIDIFNCISEILSSNNLANCGLKGNELDRAKEEAKQLTRFVLDSTVEYLDLKFEGYYPKPGSKVSRKFPLRVNGKTLISEIVNAVRRWEELSRLSLDELIEREMSHSLGEWTRCEPETFETGMEISKHLFQILVDEIVTDLWNCQQNSSWTVKRSLTNNRGFNNQVLLQGRWNCSD